MLGVPLGSQAKNAEFVQRKLFSRLDKTVDRLKDFDDSQSAFFLLRVSFSIVRAVHFMRTTPLPDWVEESARFDVEIRTAAEAILGFQFEDETSYLQACLTPSLGGFGLRRTAVHADAAYAASFLEAMGESGESWSVPSVVLSAPVCSQKAASYEIDKKIHAGLVARAVTRRERKRLERITEPHAGAWVTAVPSIDDGFDTVMQPQVFRTAAAYRLGTPVVPHDIPCPLCTQTVDKLGDHASCCKKTGDNTVRHNRVRDLLARFCGEGLLSPIVELRNLLSSSNARPGDVTIPNWHSGRPLAIDVAVTSPFTLFFTSPFTLFGMRSEEPADSYGLVYKHRKYDRRFRGKEPIFAALVMESTGGLSQEALSLLKSIFRFASRRQNIQHCVYVGRAWARLSCNLQTSVAQSILNRIDGSVYQRGTSAVLSDHELVTVSSCSSSSASSASVSFSEPASVSSSQVFPVPASVLLEPGASSAVVFNDHESVAASSSGPSPLSLSHSLLTTLDCKGLRLLARHSLAGPTLLFRVGSLLAGAFLLPSVGLRNRMFR